MHDDISRRSRRIRREAATIEAMIRAYCRRTHGGGAELCADCATLLAYPAVAWSVALFRRVRPPAASARSTAIARTCAQGYAR